MVRQQLLETPRFVASLIDAFVERFPGISTTEVEPIQGGDAFYYRIGLVSEEFESIPLMERQHILWTIAKRLLSPEQMLRISMIVAMTPEELQGDE